MHGNDDVRARSQTTAAPAIESVPPVPRAGSDLDILISIDSPGTVISLSDPLNSAAPPTQVVFSVDPL